MLSRVLTKSCDKTSICSRVNSYEKKNVRYSIRSKAVFRCFAKKKIAMESYKFEVLNEVYLQNFLHRWVVNHEMNLMMLINP